MLKHPKIFFYLKDIKSKLAFKSAIVFVIKSRQNSAQNVVKMESSYKRDSLGHLDQCSHNHWDNGKMDR